MVDLKDQISKRRTTIRPRHKKFNVHYAKGKLGIFPKGKPQYYMARPLIWQKIQLPGYLYSIPTTLLQSWHKTIIGLAIFIFLMWILTGIIWLGLAFFQLPPTQIHMEGNTSLTAEKIYQIAGIDSQLKFHQIDANETVNQLNQHPLIKHAHVRKLFPNTLSILLKELRPYAYLKVEESYYIIDEQLHPIQRISPTQLPPSFALTGIKKDAIHLGRAIASTGLQQGRELINLMRASQLPWDQFAELDVADPLNLKLKLRNPPLLVQLGHENYLEKIKTLEKVYTQLQHSEKPISSIDLRYQNRAIVRF